MPTARPRHMITETDAVHEAMSDAELRWPQLRGRPGELLHHLIAEGHRAIRASGEARRAAAEATSGVLTGVYQRDYLQQLREGWPE